MGEQTEGYEPVNFVVPHESELLLSRKRITEIHIEFGPLSTVTLGPFGERAVKSVMSGETVQQYEVNEMEIELAEKQAALDKEVEGGGTW